MRSMYGHVRSQKLPNVEFQLPTQPRDYGILRITALHLTEVWL